MLDPTTLYPLEKISTNVVFLKACITNPNITVGDYTYYDGRGDPSSFEREQVEFGYTAKLEIGKFCQIAHKAKFLLSDVNHQMNGPSTYPFFIFGMHNESCAEWANYEPVMPDKGPTVVGNDVWIGHEAVIMPGVKVGDGAIIGARAVVTRDVPPYAIVGGNPARLIRMRFTDEEVAHLLKVQWWNWPMEKISEHVGTIAGGSPMML